tara:strand:- start:306 stop:2153 length:1848 start_codon:yes stop_codon:yes gene_type:complete
MSKKNLVKSIRKNQRSYLNKDFNSLRSELVEYGQTYFSEKISDFSQNGLAGMFIEMNAYIGDVMSYYLDHQYNELNILTAVESSNIERLIRTAGVKIRGASPSTAVVSFYIEVDSELVNNSYVPSTAQLPIIKMGTLLTSTSGIKFELLEDLVFGEKDTQGKIKAKYKTMKTDDSGNPTSFSVKLDGFCTSGLTTTDTFTVPDTFKPFRTFTLAGGNVSEIISVVDSDGNEYHEVEFLSQDTVFKRVSNVLSDSELVSDNLSIVPAPYRFITTTSRNTGLTTIRFGGGDADSTDDDIMPDPSEIAVSLYGKKKTLSRLTIDPNSLLSTRTLGIAPRNTEITITYRSGGGLSHNVSESAISSVSSLVTKFNSSVSSSKVSKIRSSLEVTNTNPSKGGESALTLNELKSTVLSYQNSQGRIVTKEDLIARVYTMPSNFGRVFRAGVRASESNNLSSILSVISRDTDGKLIVSPDSMKKNLSRYLNEFRLISDAIDIVDASVVNLKISYGVRIDQISNSSLVIQKINTSIKSYMSIDNFQIDQALSMSDIVNIIINTTGVVGMVNFKIDCLSGTRDGREYSNYSFNVAANTDRGIIIPPPGSIFEVKFPEDDIVGQAR